MLVWLVLFSMSRIHAHWFHAACLEEWDEMKTEWRRTWVLGMLSTFKYHQACACAPTHLPTHRYIGYRITVENYWSVFGRTFHLSSILTVDLDAIVATYKCAPHHINLSMSSSWCSSCSLVVMVLHCWWALLWQPTVQPAWDAYCSPASREPSSANQGQGPPLIDSSV